MKIDVRRALVLAVIAAVLGGCGFKGDLVLPEKEPAALPEKPKEPSDTDPEAGGL